MTAFRLPLSAKNSWRSLVALPGVAMLLCLLAGLAGKGWAAGLGQPSVPPGTEVPQPVDEFPGQPQYPNEGVAITLMAPLTSGTVSLPALPVGGVVEMDAVEMTLPEELRVEAVGWLVNGGERRDYVWAEDPEAEFEEAPERGLGRVFLRWYWEGQRIDSMTDWLRDGNPGKGGSYEVRLYHSQETYAWGPQWPNGRYSETEMPVWFSAKAAFKVVIRGHVPLAEGEPPVFTAEPDLPVAPGVTVVPPEGILLSAMANAGGPFQMRWFRNGSAWRVGPEVRVMPGNVTQAGTDFYCEAKGPTGTVRTETFRLRAPIAPLVDFSASVNVVEAGGTLRLVPGVTEQSGVTYSWTGPALSAGYAGAQVLEDGTLEITEARMEDAGVYSLTVGNAEGAAVHEVRVQVLRLPRGVYALGAGQVIQVEGLTTSGYTVVWKSLTVPGPAEAFFKLPQGTVSGDRMQIYQPQAKMAGEYACAVEVGLSVPRNVWVQGHLVMLGTGATPFVAETEFEVSAPWEKPVMPEHALPVAHVGMFYSSLGPVTPAGGAASAAVRYQVTGLPPGLRAQTDGDIGGTPLRGGVYKLKFVAVNAQGRSAPVELLLTVQALPEGTVGEWLAFSEPGRGNPWQMQIKTTATGKYTAKGTFGPAAGRVYEDAEGRVHLHSFRGRVPETVLLPGTNTLEVATTVGGYAPGRGWRNVWSRANPPEVYAGRYNFSAQPLASPRDEATEIPVEAGHRSGTALVGATGGVKSVITGGQGVATTSGFFLGPQGQVLHEVKDRRDLTGDFFIELAIDEMGQVIQGQVPVEVALFKTATVDVVYDFNIPITRILWPAGLQREYAGRRYTPPTGGALPAGFALPETGANALLTLGLPEAQAALFAGQAGQVEAEVQSWLLAKGGRMKPLGLPFYKATCKLHLPTGMFTGKVQFTPGSRCPPSTKFQGCLVPQAEGGMVGFGATVPASGWETLPVRLEGAGVE